ncbi:hypothetical protein [Burkholderia pyrrocinia]|uniref:hypothetical protein n=1 Tax=Burkholderia pyrrocinia TaxID=60550 RepID=UPI001BCD384D|nr:hypothetical protein [Burkholderia pyrrocinia]QVN23807.1 hypothetical protein JYG32_35800 [Burkholderia pyrrocinia]
MVSPESIGAFYIPLVVCGFSTIWHMTDHPFPDAAGDRSFSHLANAFIPNFGDEPTK